MGNPIQGPTTFEYVLCTTLNMYYAYFVSVYFFYFHPQKGIDKEFYLLAAIFDENEVIS